MKDNYGSTPLHFAAMRGNEVATAALVTVKDVDVNVSSFYFIRFFDPVGAARTSCPCKIKVKKNILCFPNLYRVPGSTPYSVRLALL